VVILITDPQARKVAIVVERSCDAVLKRPAPPTVCVLLYNVLSLDGKKVVHGSSRILPVMPTLNKLQRHHVVTLQPGQVTPDIAEKASCVRDDQSRLGYLNHSFPDVVNARSARRQALG